MYDLQRLMRIATGPEAKRAVPKVLLVDRLQQHHNGPLRHLVLERRNAERTLTTVRLVDVVTSDRRRAITTRFKTIEQALQVLLQLGRMRLPGPTVDYH